ncbi:hypothetical protein [Halogeometricum sp. CBA1124]|uniref:hypothetical protein n=1 Tax=Halogeometricum sp. CBA1124 TaxID=2668071 RepID=UPI001429EFB8|nr:hypothetical protein [Halogeometricum sp. CBA1124]MUV56092.1 hypothetical protein [Halogeometricum sp. CBA1124]
MPGYNLRDYTQYIDPKPFKGISNYMVEKADKLLDSGEFMFYKTRRDIVLLFEKVSQECSYERTGREVVPPEKMDWQLQGDCTDQSVYLGSLYAAAETVSRVRLVYVGNNDGDRHLLLEVAPHVTDMTLNEFRENLRSAYRKLYDRDVGPMYFEFDEGKPWFVTDPVMSNYVGDVDSLRRSGFVQGDQDSWWWTELDCYKKPSKQRIHDSLDYK